MTMKGRLGTAIKLVFAVAVVAGVSVYFWRIFRDPDLNAERFVLRWPPLALAGLLYLTAHTLWGTFWWQLLRAHHADVPWHRAVTAYFISQLGKYVPGKVWVIVMRVTLLGDTALKRTIVATGIYETLTSMAAGAALGAIFFPYLTGGETVVRGGAIALIALAFVPLLAGVINRLAVRMLNKRREADAPPLRSPPIWLLAVGLLQACVGWCLLAVSLRLVVAGVVPSPPELSPLGFCQDLAATTVMYVAGFVVIVAPGGVGARELILQKALVPVLRPISGDAAVGLAAVVAIVVRVVWTVAELAMIGILSAVRRLRRARSR
jgi:hypothetical protein